MSRTHPLVFGNWGSRHSRTDGPNPPNSPVDKPSTKWCRAWILSTSVFHLDQSLVFPWLILKGIYHCWKSLHFPVGLSKSKVWFAFCPFGIRGFGNQFGGGSVWARSLAKFNQQVPAVVPRHHYPVKFPPKCSPKGPAPSNYNCPLHVCQRLRGTQENMSSRVCMPYCSGKHRLPGPQKKKSHAKFAGKCVHQRVRDPVKKPHPFLENFNFLGHHSGFVLLNPHKVIYFLQRGRCSNQDLGMSQNQTTTKTAGLVYMSIYQGSTLGTYF